MKALRIFFCIITVTTCAFGTSVKKSEKPFEETVSEADHIVIGKVLSVTMHDKTGREVRDPNACTEPHSGNVITIRMSVRKDGILKTSAKKFPEIITYALWDALVLDLGGMKEVEGQSFIVLLEKEDFQPHGIAPFDFMWPLDWRDKVTKVIEAKKQGSSQHLQPIKSLESASDTP